MLPLTILHLVKVFKGWSDQIRSDQSLSRVPLFATPWITAHQASLFITNSRSSLRLSTRNIQIIRTEAHNSQCCESPACLLPCAMQGFILVLHVILMGEDYFFLIYPASTWHENFSSHIGSTDISLGTPATRAIITYLTIWLVLFWCFKYKQQEENVFLSMVFCILKRIW